MLTLEQETETEETLSLYEYCVNDPVNTCDPSGLAPEADPWAPKPPVGVPEFFTVRYPEQQWKDHPVTLGENSEFGPYTYKAISKTDLENVAQAVLANAGRGLHDIPGAPYVLLKGLFTWSKPEFFGSRDRIDYVDVTYKLSLRHYTNVGDKAGIDAMDLAWFRDHQNATVQQLSQSLNSEFKYWYIQQFGGAVAAEFVGGVLQFRSVAGEAQAATGGPAAIGEMLAGNAKIQKYIAELGPRTIVEDAQCVIQTRETNCVPASLEQALGTDARTALGPMNAKAIKDTRFAIDEAVTYLRSRGLAPNAQLRDTISLDQLQGMVQGRSPVLLNVRGTDPTGTVGHAILIQGWRDGQFEIADPLVGVYLQSPADLAARMKGYGQAIINLR